MSNTVYIATSIDGYIAREDGTIDWLMNLPNPDNSDYGFSVFLEIIDGIIMGRKSFETVSHFDEWPYPKPVFVLSNSLHQLTGRFSEKAEIVRGELKTIIESLKKKGISNLYVDSGKTIQSFLKRRFNLELVFEHVATEVYNNMLVRSQYLRK